MVEEVVGPADVGMRDPAGEVDLPPEALERVLSGRDRGQDRLERDTLAELEVLRLVQLAHPAACDEAPDAEPPGENRTFRERGRARGIARGIGARDLDGRPRRVARSLRPGFPRLAVLAHDSPDSSRILAEIGEDTRRMAHAPTLIGIPYDASSSFLRGSAGAPPLVREALFS